MMYWVSNCLCASLISKDCILISVLGKLRVGLFGDGSCWELRVDVT